MSITPAAREALRTIAALVSGATERPVNMSDALIAAVPIVRAHLDEVPAALPRRADS